MSSEGFAIRRGRPAHPEDDDFLSRLFVRGNVRVLDYASWIFDGSAVLAVREARGSREETGVFHGVGLISHKAGFLGGDARRPAQSRKTIGVAKTILLNLAATVTAEADSGNSQAMRELRNHGGGPGKGSVPDEKGQSAVHPNGHGPGICAIRAASSARRTCGKTAARSDSNSAVRLAGVL